MLKWFPERSRTRMKWYKGAQRKLSKKQKRRNNVESEINSKYSRYVFRAREGVFRLDGR